MDDGLSGCPRSPWAPFKTGGSNLGQGGCEGPDPPGLVNSAALLAANPGVCYASQTSSKPTYRYLSCLERLLPLAPGISFIRQAIRAATSPCAQPTIDVLLNSRQKNRLGQHGLEALVRRVLCSNAQIAPLPASEVDPNCMKVILNEKGEIPMSTAKPKELPDLSALFDGHIAAEFAT